MLNVESKGIGNIILQQVYYLPNTCFWLFIPGLPREPKYGHLKYLHKAIKLAEPTLVATDELIKFIYDRYVISWANVW